MRTPHRARALLLAGLVAAGGAAAQKPSNITDSELTLLPEFCQYTMGFKLNKTPQRARWAARLGPSFEGLHHYCWAQINLYRLRFNPTGRHSRADLAKGIVGDLTYVLQHATPDFALLPEIYATLVEAELMRENPGAAIVNLNESLRLKPDYVRPYQIWGEYLLASGPPGPAREFLKTGLEHNPDDKRLRALYTRAGGDPSTIVPRPPMAPAPASEPASAAASAPVDAAVPPNDAASAPATR